MLVGDRDGLAVLGKITGSFFGVEVVLVVLHRAIGAEDGFGAVLSFFRVEVSLVVIGRAVGAEDGFEGIGSLSGC